MAHAEEIAAFAPTACQSAANGLQFKEWLPERAALQIDFAFNGGVESIEGRLLIVVATYR